MWVPWVFSKSQQLQIRQLRLISYCLRRVVETHGVYQKERESNKFVSSLAREVPLEHTVQQHPICQFRPTQISAQQLHVSPAEVHELQGRAYIHDEGLADDIEAS